jgi:hypothetical protein
LILNYERLSSMNSSSIKQGVVLLTDVTHRKRISSKIPE